MGFVQVKYIFGSLNRLLLLTTQNKLEKESPLNKSDFSRIGRHSSKLFCKHNIGECFDIILEVSGTIEGVVSG